MLGAARITRIAAIAAAAEVPGVRLEAVAARDPDRARRFASKHGVARAFDGYAALVGSDAVDAVYVALPNGLHAEWSQRALEAGKHVLCEKPLSANASQAERLVAAARASGRVLVEAFHYADHPAMARLVSLLAEGALGRLRSIRGRFCAPIPEGDIRYDLALAGGALMDLGCYPLHAMRRLAGREPEVEVARAVEGPRGIDRSLEARLAFGGDLRGTLTCDMSGASGFDCELAVEGERGGIRLKNAFAPLLGARLLRDGDPPDSGETFPGPTSYVHQLRAFDALVRTGGPDAREARLADALGNMSAIDAIYRSAGLPTR